MWINIFGWLFNLVNECVALRMIKFFIKLWLSYTIDFLNSTCLCESLHNVHCN